MRITRLRLSDVRRLRDLDLELAPGLTIVRGPNEAGKSTVQRAIEIGLSRKVTSTQADLEAMRPWDADAEARPVVRLDFVQEEADRVRRGQLEKSFRGARGTVRLDLDGEVTTDPARVEELLADLTGIPTEPFFRSTASVRHHELADLDRDEAALRDRLQASISGADRGTSAARRKLERAIRDLQQKGERNPGRLRVAEEAVARTRTIVEKGEAGLVQLERDRDALVGAQDRRRAAEARLGETRSMLEKARQAQRLMSEEQAAAERFERYRDAVVTSEESGRLEGSHPSPTPPAALRPLVERLRVLDREIAGLAASLGEEAGGEFQIAGPEPGWRPWAALASALGLASAALAALAALGLASGSLFDAPVLGGVLVSLLASVLLALHAVRRHGLVGGARRARQLRDDQVARRLRGRSQLEDDLRQKEAEAAGALATLALPDLAAAEDLLGREEAHVQSIERLQSKLEGLVGRQPPEVLPAMRDAAALEKDQKTAALDALGPIAREPRARERLEAGVREDEDALERQRDDEARARARVEANTVDAEQVAGEAERLAGWTEQLAALRRRARVYGQTLAAIDRAERATMQTATRYLERTMVHDILRITDGRYRRVRVDDRTLGIAVFAPEKGDWVDVTQLSQGTIDQVYLAARLGLVRLVTGDRRPPLIFDDPFVAFDDVRALRTLSLLRELAADFQVIFLTTSGRYDQLADRVVALAGPVARDDAPDLPQPAADGAPYTPAPPAPGIRA